MKWILQILILLISYSINSQVINELEINLVKKLELVHYEKNHQKALEYNEDFKLLLAKTLQKEEAFDYSFDSLSNFMSTVKSPDGNFRLFNWNIQLNNQKQHYDCWIYFSDQSIVKLIDNERKVQNIEYLSLQSNEWFGALYFDIIPVSKKNKTVYTLLGWDGNDMFSNKKVIETLIFDKKNNPQFGTPIFNYPDGKNKRRVIFQYNKDSYMSLKHNYLRKENYIVFDHLIPTSPNLKDFPDWYVTDLSFDAFKWENNQWRYEKDFDAKSLRALRRPFNDPKK
jgi:hypothetical protein